MVGAVSTPVARLSATEVLRLTLNNRLLWILAIGFFCANAVRYSFMNWTVTYMKDFHGLTIKGSAFMSIALPLIGAIGAVSAGWVSDNWFGKRRAPVCAVMLFGLVLVCIGFVFIPQGSWGIATAMLGLAGFLIYGPDMLMSGAATVDFSHPRAAAAATGFTMATGAAGAILSGAGIGWLKDVTPGIAEAMKDVLPAWLSAVMTPWTLIFYLLAGLTSIAALLMVSIWNAKPKGG
jgi:sugar phosphate permease